MGALTSAQYITTGISLIAFAIAAALIAYRSRLNQRVRIISQAEPSERVRAIESTAQEFGVNLSGLSIDQQAEFVFRIINSRRFYALLLFLCIIVAAVFGIIYILINPIQVITMNVGPVTLDRGETRNVDFEMQRQGYVDVKVTNIVPDWTGLDELRRKWKEEGKGDTPEIWYSICSASEDNVCRGHGDQRGINGTSRKSLQPGPATIAFFNFREDPPVAFSAVVKY